MLTGKKPFLQVLQEIEKETKEHAILGMHIDVIQEQQP
jgi:hypothetical protein